MYKCHAERLWCSACLLQYHVAASSFFSLLPTRICSDLVYIWALVNLLWLPGTLQNPPELSQAFHSLNHLCIFKYLVYVASHTSENRTEKKSRSEITGDASRKEIKHSGSTGPLEYRRCYPLRSTSGVHPPGLFPYTTQPQENWTAGAPNGHCHIHQRLFGNIWGCFLVIWMIRECCVGKC